MPAKDFKFISPGVFINEIDNSQLPREAGDIGPVIIGRASQGPGLVPTRVNSFQEFVEVFGTPEPGGAVSDVSRTAINPGPTYGAYAAQAWLRNNSPVTFVRLVGQQNSAAGDGGEAGWEVLNGTDSVSPEPSDDQGGAYGLFVFASGSAANDANNALEKTAVSASLAAVWYVTTGSVALSGTVFSGSNDFLIADGNPITSTTAPGGKATSRFVKSTEDGEFKVVISNGITAPGEDGTIEIDTKFNFNRGSENFIRRVFNTDPTLTNSAITDENENAYKTYWLGETYEDELRDKVLDSSTRQFGVILPLFKGNVNGADFKRDYSDPETGYFIAQDLTNDAAGFDAANQEKLFKLVARNTGRWASRSVKISIADLRASTDPDNPYGTFSVQVRAMDDTDNRPKILEQFNNCNLNPASENFIARKIGDKYLEWDDAERRYIEYGDFANNSDYVYVVLDPAVRDGQTNEQHLPFGVFGPPRFLPISASDVNGATNTLVTGNFDFANDVMMGEQVTAAEGIGPNTLVSGGLEYPITLTFPSLRLRVSSSEGNPVDPRAVYYGVDTTFNQNSRPSKTIGDYTGPKPFGVSSVDPTTTGDAQTERMFVFTLDDMCTTDLDAATTNVTGTLVHKSGSRQDATIDGVKARGGLTYVRGTTFAGENYRKLLELGADRFTTVLHGGFDGLDITEAEPFRNTLLSGKTEATNYAFNSLRIAIDSLRDPENVEFDLATMPGVTNNVLNRNLVDMCEGRGDALAIIDLQGGYVPSTENTATAASNLGSVDSTINNKRDSLQLNSSFGCAYYPWVQIQDTINGAILWAPPSVAALGAMSYGQKTQELWFAPAGFTRGGLSANNAAGIPVVGVRQRLISKERDKLYEANINPIAQFPAEGIVIFGQKTLQVTPSALDRINVRRLLIFLKKEISRAAATLLFDQNVQTTWDRFRGQVEPFLASVKVRLGLTEYKLVLDETTTTPDLIDRNVMYAQIFLKPARAIEFIAVDFVITDSGASFDD